MGRTRGPDPKATMETVTWLETEGMLGARQAQKIRRAVLDRCSMRRGVAKVAAKPKRAKKLVVADRDASQMKLPSGTSTTLGS